MILPGSFFCNFDILNYAWFYAKGKQVTGAQLNVMCCLSTMKLEELT